MSGPRVVSACRDADRRLEAEVRAAIAAGDVGALATRAFQPVAVNILSPYSRAFTDLLTGGFALPLRVMRGLSVHADAHTTYTKAATVRKLRATTGRTREIVFGLLTGEGDPDAVTLRRLAEAVRGAALPVYALDEAATKESVAFEERSEANKRAALARVQRAERPRATLAERTAAAIAERSAKQLERDAARERKREARRKRRELCGEGPDTLEPRLSYRERQALEGGQQ